MRLLCLAMSLVLGACQTTYQATQALTLNEAGYDQSPTQPGVPMCRTYDDGFLFRDTHQRAAQGLGYYCLTPNRDQRFYLIPQSQGMNLLPEVYSANAFGSGEPAR